MVGRSGASVARTALVTANPAHPALPDIRKHLGQGGEENLDLAAEQAGQGQTAAAIGDVVDIDLRARLQKFAFDMRKRSDPGRGEVQRMPGSRLRQRRPIRRRNWRRPTDARRELPCCPQSRATGANVAACSRRSCRSPARSEACSCFPSTACSRPAPRRRPIWLRSCRLRRRGSPRSPAVREPPPSCPTVAAP